jgi:predicted DNA-binding protein (MmcQ/YjbR family)
VLAVAANWIKNILIEGAQTNLRRHTALLADGRRGSLANWQSIWLATAYSQWFAPHCVFRGNNPMNNSALLEYCMAKPGAHQSDQNQWQASQIKVGDVMFAMVCEVQGRPALAIKSSPELAESLREQHPEIVPCEHLNKAHWNAVFLDGNLPNSQFYHLIDSSYRLVLEGLPEQVRQELRI